MPSHTLTTGRIAYQFQALGVTLCDCEDLMESWERDMERAAIWGDYETAEERSFRLSWEEEAIDWALDAITNEYGD